MKKLRKGIRKEQREKNPKVKEKKIISYTRGYSNKAPISNILDVVN